LNLDELQKTERLLRPYVIETPLLPSKSLPGVSLKTENLQLTGSFKLRTAFSQLLQLSEEDRQKGVVTSSSGNFAQAVAYACEQLGVRATIVMMKSSSPFKVNRTQGWGADVVFCEDHFADRQRVVDRIRSEKGLRMVHPYDDPAAVLGNATIGIEILRQSDRVQNVVVPISGGGLAAGVSAALAAMRSSAKVWGVQPEGANATFLSFRKGAPVSIDRARTIADGLVATRPGDYTFPIMKERLETVLTVTEREIKEAVRHLFLEEKLVVEPSGAASVAAVMAGKVSAENSVCILSGGNMSFETLDQCFTTVDNQR